MHQIESRGSRHLFIMDGWRVTLRPRLGLHQLAEHTFDGAPMVEGRSVWEYAIGLLDGDRKAWAGNWHKWEIQTGLKTTSDSVTRRSIVLNPLRRGRPLAVSHVTYRPGDDGLTVDRTMRWLTDATLGLNYVAMLPLGPDFHTPTGEDRETGRTLTAATPDIEARMTVADEALLSIPIRRGLVKLYAARSTNENPERVRKGDVHHHSVTYSLART